MKSSRGMIGMTGALCTLLLSLVLPLAGSGAKTPNRLRSGQTVTLTGFGTGSPAAADPRRASLLGRAGLADASESTFRFTPSSSTGGRRAVTVAVRARSVNRTDATRMASITTQLAPAAYNLGVAVGWKRFALSGDIARVQGMLLPDNREAAEVGVSYSGNRWNTRVEVGADRMLGDRASLIGTDESYSLGLGGAYSLTHNLEVTGGLRYRMQRDRFNQLLDDRRDSQSVYIGTAFRF